MPTPGALHSAKTPKWGTPGHIIELARELMGGIHMDPASSEEFNALVKALMIYTEQSNGLAPESTWIGNVFLNPPGGLVVEFWDKLIAEIQAGRVERVVWIGFSVEQLCILADKDYHPLDFSTCILRKRLSFIREDGTKGDSPSHGCYVCAINCDHAKFKELFGKLGHVSQGDKHNLALDLSPLPV